jgi:cysteine desulfurase
MVYFDHNATTPLSTAARQAWLHACDAFSGNPSSPHRIGSRADAALQDARQRLSEILGCDPYHIVWTSGATESNNTMMAHFARNTPTSAEVLISAVEHPCVMQAAMYYFGKRCRQIPVDPSGVVDLNWLAEELAHKRPSLVAVMAANNETGVLQPWRELLAMCRQWSVPFFSDAVQWIGKLPAKGLGDCDFMSGSAHKFGGPKGAGFLKCTGGLSQLFYGGPQEEGRRAGTENVPGILSMVAALEEREERLKSDEQIVRVIWREAFERELLRVLNDCEIVGGPAERLWNTVSVVMPKVDCRQRWVVKLDKAGFAVSTGSACSSGKEQPSHVLAAMGYDAARASRVIRISSGWDTDESDWRRMLEGIKKVATVMASR